MVIIDTSVIIDHLRQAERTNSPTPFEEAIDKYANNNTLGISIITIQELYQGKSTRDENAETTLLNTIAPLPIFPYTHEVAELAGKIVRDGDLLVEFADAAIAATALARGAKLFTLNGKHFKGIPDLDLLKL